MGNMQSRAHPTAGQNTQPRHPAHNNHSSTEVSLEASYEEQRRRHLDTQTELARRKTAEAQARLQRQEQELKATRERERRLEEQNQIMIEIQARRSREREERRKVEEARAGQELQQETAEAHARLQRQEQELKATRERERRLEEQNREILETQARRAREQEELKAARKRERLLEEHNREMLETNVRRAIEREERRKATEHRARQEQELKAMDEEQERLRLEEERRREMLAMPARRAHGEERRKAEEVNTKQEREQELDAMQAREILRLGEKWREILETPARRAREQEEERHKAKEVRARQEREQELKAMHEKEEKQRQEKVVAPPLCLRMPEVCRRHNSRQGCTDQNCRRLHICRLFLADICKHGVSCHYGHSLTTVHNQMICSRNNLDTARQLALLRQLRFAIEQNDELPETMYVNNLETCYKFCSRSSCDENDCNRIHICRQFIAGVCGLAGCKFGHDLHSKHNNGVLDRHRVTAMSDTEILDILRQKENRGTQRVNGAAPAVTSAKNGAIPRHRSSGAGNQPSQKSQKSHLSQAPDGLSEQLQCPVCLEMFRRATTLGCGHTFCADCLQDVRARSGDNCPLCRAPISSATRSVTLDNIIRSMSA